VERQEAKKENAKGGEKMKTREGEGAEREVCRQRTDERNRAVTKKSPRASIRFNRTEFFLAPHFFAEPTQALPSLRKLRRIAQAPTLTIRSRYDFLATAPTPRFRARG